MLSLLGKWLSHLSHYLLGFFLTDFLHSVRCALTSVVFVLSGFSEYVNSDDLNSNFSE